MAFQAGSHVWIPDEDEVVIPAKVVTTFSPGSAGKVTRLDTDKTVKLSAAATKGITQMHEQCLEGVEDMVKFKELDENSILHNLRSRFEDDKIYTNIGRILTSVNPFKMLPIYTPSVMDEYMEKGSRNMPPHVYGVADDAFNALIDNKKSQSCIVSGESGAGKTEATKVFLQFISEKSKRQTANGSTFDDAEGVEMQQKILESNPLMEAFGNAKTVRNDNSSRFGKWIEVQFDTGNGNIIGGSIKSYLLEKSRIVRQSDNERNYHIFYQLCTAAGIDPSMGKYNISDASQYFYLNQSEDPCINVPSIDDGIEWQATCNAMEKIGITAEEKEEVINILNIVLNVGNVTFTGGDKSKAENPSVVATTAELIGCSPEDLERALVKIDRSNPADPNLVSDSDVGQACDARDAFAKYIYSLLFDWLIAKINISLGRVPESPNISTIGVLDIFGFEFFQNNSFEQLCINYCNERLQGHFNNHIFKLEQEQYELEGIDVTKIDFEDNAHVIRTIDFKGSGILQIIANELKLKTSTDMTLLKKFKAEADKVTDEKMQVLSYPSHKELKASPELETVFRVNHYAGKVSYRIEQFLEKNRDAVPGLLIKLGKKAKNPFIKTLFDNSAAAKKQALGIRFSVQLKSLMNDLEATQPHFIRCVKPNAEKVKESFTAQMVLAQLRYAGLLEVCRIRQMGYPVRRGHQEFYKRYRHLAEKPVSNHTELIAELTNMEMVNEKELQVGKNKVFMKTACADTLEEQRALSLSLWVTQMQRVVRGFLVRVVSNKWSQIRKDLAEAVSSRDKNLLEGALLGFGALPYGGKHLDEYKQAKELKNRIEDEERIARLISDAINSRDKDQIIAALKAAEEKKLMGTPEAKEAQNLLELIEKEDVCKIALREAIAAKDEEKLKNAVSSANSLSLSNITLCKDAVALLKAIDKERTCRRNLQEALDSGDVEKIKMFMNQMADIGRADDPLVKQGEEIVKEKAQAAAEIEARKEALMFGLMKAIRDRNLQALEKLEMEVIDLGIENEVTENANEMRIQLQKEMDICAKLNAESTAANAKGQTRAGLVKEDLVALEKIIEEAEDILPADDFQLLSAKDDLHQLESKLRVQSELEQVVIDYKAKKAAFVKEKEVTAKNAMEQELLDMLKKANDLAVENGAETEAASEVKEKLNQLKLEIDERHKQEREEKKAQAMARLKESNEDDRLEEDQKRIEHLNEDVSEKHKQLIQEASNNQRYHVSKYYRLRADEDYVEKLPNDLKLNAAKNKLLSQPKPIVKSLCRLDRKESDMAIKINKAILQYCGDLNVNFPATLAQFMLMKGLEDQALTDEIFLQLMKHITANPKPDSADRAWLLMCMATRTFPPPDEFAPFLLNFFISRQKASGLVGNYARLCIVQLEATMELGPTWFKPNIEEIQNYRKRPPILAPINNLDGTTFEYPITPDMRVAAVIDLLKRKNGIEINDDEQPIWGIYVSPEEEIEIYDPKERLIKFYQHYNPSKLAHVDLFLDHWKDNTEELFQKLISKYGPEPSDDEKVKKKGMLALPITAAMNAVKFLGFATQKEQPPPPQTPWPVPWWTHLGDVYYRMAKQKKVPRFTFKRRMITRTEPIDKWLYLQAVSDVRNGYLPIEDTKSIARLAALAMAYDHGVEKMSNSLTIPVMKDLGVDAFIPNYLLADARGDGVIIDTIQLFAEKKIPSTKEEIMAAYVGEVRLNPVYGMNYFYARHSASDKNYVIAVDIDGIHVLETDRTKVKRSFVFDTIKKFGATAEYFWMNIDENREPEKQARFKFLSASQGINVLLYTLQSWEMYDCVYDATHLGIEDDEDE